MNFEKIRKYLLIGFLGVCSTKSNSVDLVVFSFDRPLQLYALLESTHKFITGLSTIQVIYRVSSSRYDDAYNKLKKEFNDVSFIKQGSDPSQDFKPLVLNAVFNSPTPYILFAVDDNVVKDSVDLSVCIDFLEKTKAWGFYLRLGRNITNYIKKPIRLPRLTREFEGVYTWQFYTGGDDWAYPNNVDMTLYRKKDIERDLKLLPYSSPNTMEGSWYMEANTRDSKKKGVCFELSKIVNIPMNLVQKDWVNPHMNLHSVEELLQMFEEGEKLDIKSISARNNTAVHDFEYKPVFIKQ